MEVDEEQEVDRSDPSRGMGMEQLVWSVVTEEVEQSELSLLDWETRV